MRLAVPDMKTLRPAALLALCLVLAASCAQTRGQLAGERPRTVAVLVRNEAERPQAGGLLEDFLGGQRPESLVAREAIRALRGRGYRVVDAIPDPEHGVPSAEAWIRETRADAALVIRLERMDVSALKAIGQAEIDLEASLVDAKGAILWSRSRRGPTLPQTYRAQADWSAHLRMALGQLLGELP
ncbi:hypothetical protein [Vulgatibacter incomptus]|uniref:Lipoprotein n=1 Tax=Vulgatibacter incomptus TaxID=1391653 RepID=A0A0K1PCE2_9BACT|nr:hypothetical protein [Vulgatibacter incomptus]AKU91086.1 hypothetical protein AKJ08_1473 [Vulgatibacter incomptus]